MSNLFYCGPIGEYDFKTIKELSIVSHQFLAKENFYRLKKKLKQIKLRYFIEDFGDIPSILTGEKFDVIYLSAMQNYIWDNVHGYNYYKKLKEYENLLNKNGVIQGGYLYWQHFKESESDCDWYINLFKKKGYEKQEIDIFTGKKAKYANIAMLKRNKKR